MCKFMVPFSLQLHERAAVMSLTQRNEHGGGSDAAQGVRGELCWVQPLNQQCQRGGCDRIHSTLGWHEHTTQLHSWTAGPKLSPPACEGSALGNSCSLPIVRWWGGHRRRFGSRMSVPLTHTLQATICIYSSGQRWVIHHPERHWSSWICCSLCLF